MNLEKDLYLTSSRRVDVTKLSYNEMMHYVKHNIHLHINCLLKIYFSNTTKNK